MFHLILECAFSLLNYKNFTKIDGFLFNHAISYDFRDPDTAV